MQPFESAGKPVSDGRLLLRGTVLAAVILLVCAALWAKSEGRFSARVPATVLLTNVGDGLPDKSDVKFRGALVGQVEDVSPSIDGTPNVVQISLDPQFTPGIPAAVTARVVPGNVFAVSSIQLIDNGPGTALTAGAIINEDQSLQTVQFQTALTRLRDVVAAAGRPESNNSVGILAAVAAATDRRGDELTNAAGGANRIVRELNTIMADDGTESMIGELSGALTGLQAASPDLLDALHRAVVPMRTVAEKRQELTNFLSAGISTLGTMGTAFENNTDRLIMITTQLSPVLGVLADAGKDFVPITTRINTLSQRFLDNVWNPQRNLATGKFMLVVTPNSMYTRQDCPRYGDLEGASCQTAPLSADPPVISPVFNPRNLPPPPGGNVGIVGSPQERAQIAEILGPDANPASDLLLSPVLRGNTVAVVAEPTPAEVVAPGANP